MDPERSQSPEDAAAAAPSAQEPAAAGLPVLGPIASGEPGPSTAPVVPVSPVPISPEPFSLVSPELERLPPPEGTSHGIPGFRGQAPSYVFLAVVSIVSLASDIGTKLWAEHHLDALPGPLDVWAGHLDFILAKNRGGAWGLLQSTNENVRRPFFLLVSAAAIAFIVTLYRRLQPTQRALKWGLPLVLGGALGNVFDRIRYGHVIDFIDIHVTVKGVDHHWPTFNVADIAICVGVGLMAIDMFTSRRPKRAHILPPPGGPTPGSPLPGAEAVSEAAPALPTNEASVGTAPLPGEPVETKPAS